MTHPEELLAEYVDGTLPERERADVSAHLDACPRCRADVALATSARAALAGLDEPAIPVGLAAPALDEARSDAAERAPNVRPLRGGATPPGWYRWAVGAGVAAAIVLLGAVVLPNLGQSNDAADVESAGSAVVGPGEEGPAPRATGVESSGALSDDQLRELALSALGQPPATEATADAAFGSATDEAERCLRTAFKNLRGSHPVRLLAARYRDKDAYLGFYLDSPGAGLPPEYVRVWMATRDGCEAIGSAQFAP